MVHLNSTPSARVTVAAVAFLGSLGGMGCLSKCRRCLWPQEATVLLVATRGCPSWGSRLGAHLGLRDLPRLTLPESVLLRGSKSGLQAPLSCAAAAKDKCSGETGDLGTQAVPMGITSKGLFPHLYAQDAGPLSRICFVNSFLQSFASFFISFLVSLEEPKFRILIQSSVWNCSFMDHAFGFESK